MSDGLLSLFDAPIPYLRTQTKNPIRMSHLRPTLLPAMLAAALFFTAWQVVLPIAPQRLLAAAPTAAAEKEFDDKIKPLFSKHCFECHSASAEELKGKLKLDTLADVLRGGAQGVAVRPGDPAGSLLLRAIKYEEADYQMPPRGKIPAKEVEEIEKWIKELKS